MLARKTFDLWERPNNSRFPRVPGLDLEYLEPRLVLTSLSSFLTNDGPTFAPSDGTGEAALQVVGSEDPDLVFLADAVPDEQLTALDRATSPLLKVYSQHLQGSARTMEETRLWGTPWNHMFLSDGVLPLVDVYVQDVDAAQLVLEQLGMEVFGVADTDSWQIVTGYLPVSAIADVATSTPGLIVLDVAERGYSAAELARDGTEDTVTHHDSLGWSGAESGDGGEGSGGPLEAQGSVANEWESVSFADQLKRVLGFEADGLGLDVGVMSDTIDFVNGGISDSQSTGDLPPGGRVVNLDDAPSGKDEGRAMAELVYDLVDVDIIHHTGLQGATDYADGIDELRQAGADVITEDISYYGQPVFQDGIIAQAIDNVYLFHDVFVFGSAGNRNNESYYNTWDEGPNNFHEFSLGGDQTINVTLSPGEELSPILHWNQAWGNATTDIDIEIYDASLTTKLADSNTNNIGGNPVDFLTFTNNTGATASFHMAFRRVSGSATGLQLSAVSPFNDDDFSESYVLNQRGGIAGNHAATFTFSMGAVPWDNPDTIEPFSSHGPNTIYFSDIGTPVNPFDRLKPDFTAADGVSTTVPGFGSFFGTSAASPNAAAVAVQIMDATNGPTTYTQMSNLFADTAIGSGVGAWDGVHGEGRINALGAGMVAFGMESNEFFLEPNPFGDVTLDNSLFSNTDRDRAVFALDNGGITSVDVSESDGTFDAAEILWDGESGSFVEIDYNDGPGDDPSITRSLDSWNLYQVSVFSETDVTGASSTDFTLSVDGPSVPTAQVGLDDNGDATLTGQRINVVQDADYYRFVAPIDLVLNRNLTLSVNNVDSTLNTVLTLYDAAGNVIQRSNSGGAGGSEQIIESGISPGETYYARVGSFNYASSGFFDLNLDFQASVLPATYATGIEGFAAFHRDGSSQDVLSVDANLNFNGDFDSYWFAGDGSWTGEYLVSASEVASGVDTILAVYDGTTREMIAFDDDGGPGLNSELTTTLSAWTNYLVVVGDFGNNSTGDVEINITAPSSSVGATIPIDGDGHGTVESARLFNQSDTSFYDFAAPPNADGTLTVTITPTSANLNTVAFLFDDAGNELARGISGATGNPDTLLFTGVVPSATYFLSVLPSFYDSFGFFNIDVDFAVSLAGDFDANREYTCNDVDMLVADIASGLNSPHFDLNGDTFVDEGDLDIWLAVAASFNGLGSAYKRGDANLDGAVDGPDFVIWNKSKFTSVAAWCRGDFNADGIVDGLDFVLWNSNKFTSSDDAEPDTVMPRLPDQRLRDDEATGAAIQDKDERETSVARPSVAPAHSIRRSTVAVDQVMRSIHSGDREGWFISPRVRAKPSEADVSTEFASLSATGLKPQ